MTAIKRTLSLAVVAACLLAGALVAGTSNTAHAGFGLAVPAHYDVVMFAPNTAYSGTASTIWFRTYSENKAAWGPWRSTVGLPAGGMKSIAVTEAAGFTELSAVQVYVGQNDGVRINFEITGDAGTQISTPADKWVKNGYYTFDLMTVAQAGTFCCDSSTMTNGNVSGWNCHSVDAGDSCPGQTLVDCTGNSTLDNDGNLSCGPG